MKEEEKCGCVRTPSQFHPCRFHLDRMKEEAEALRIAKLFNISIEEARRCR